MRQAVVEVGIPQEYIDRGAATVAQWQQMAAQDLSDKQIAANREIADKQQKFNEEQVKIQQGIVDEQKSEAKQQAERQTDYDTGRNKNLAAGTKAIDDAFGRFTGNNEVFDRYARDYMSKASDDIGRQRTQAQKDLAFQLARQGISSSQAGVNQQGLLDETAGRASAEQSANAQNAADTLRNNILASKSNLMQQLEATQSIGSPIAGSTGASVNSALQTQRSAISGIQSNAGDVVANVNAVPNVNSLGQIFAGILGTAGSALSGVQANNIRGQFSSGLAGTNPSGTGSTR